MRSSHPKALSVSRSDSAPTVRTLKVSVQVVLSVSKESIR
jgi:hypothetical protein